ncbi:sugar phosphate isomerase/epimerase family protein [Pseudobutyrivibrio ruminis]|uniref:Sugar phosphate isomerase/epimerase n=1 Tax=Pseudobutyrivibrio ruminis DSM 9787 TaxID=1123011 RepID=A0A285S985_9FIRM|nr:sugar phosphate isomerase/epimerase family protein [Pseudobutyrivibrio ruminis]SOC04152.1 Sugar phosphate isomerase/epimerase [Pseudobutyrivibrio ruminis DSM 9787]
MHLSISNIGWTVENDNKIYEMMRENGFDGVEIAPTRIILEAPYDHLNEASNWKKELKNKYGFEISSMQSIWFGRSEKLFGTEEEREALLSYTKKAIDFAETIGCKNLVFGCPRNRNFPENGNMDVAVSFFKELGDYAYAHNTVLAMEANPPIYNTNFVNTTAQAIDLIKQVDSKGFLLNLDMGTMIENNESIDVLKDNIRFINHVHVSEPGLKPIEKRDIHKELAQLLKEKGYDKYVSIEVGKQEDVEKLADMMEYVKEIFG